MFVVICNQIATADPTSGTKKRLKCPNLAWKSWKHFRVVLLQDKSATGMSPMPRYVTAVESVGLLWA